MPIRRPLRPPVGVVPVDMIPRAVFPRSAGRPRHIPQSTPQSTPSKKRAPFTPSKSSDPTKTPSQRDYARRDDWSLRTGSSTPSPSDRALSSKRSRVDLNNGFTGKRLRASDDLTRLVNSDDKLAEWSQTVYHRDEERHFVGNLSLHRIWPKSSILDIPLEPTVVEGITMRKGFLRRMDDNLGEDAEYETRELPVSQIIRFMDQQPHDYTLDSHSLSSRATILFQDGPGIRPADVRARRLQVKVLKADTLKSSPDRILWRVVYYCNNLCRNIIPGVQKMPALDTDDHLEEQLLALATEGKKRFLERERRSYTADSIDTPSESTNRRPPKQSSPTKFDHDRARRRTSQSLNLPALNPHLWTQGNDPFPLAGGAEEDESEDEEESSEEDIGSRVTPLNSTLGRLNTPSYRSASQDTESLVDHRSSVISGVAAVHKPRRGADHCRTRLVIEMTVNQSIADMCTVYFRKKEHHPPAIQREDLRSSPFLRRALHEAASVFGMTPFALKQFQYNTLLHTPHAEWLAVHCSHRLPKNRDHEQAVITAQKAARLDKNPLVGIEIIARRHPEVFLHCDVPKCLEDDWDGHLDGDTRLDLFAWAFTWIPPGATRMPFDVPSPFWRLLIICAMLSKHADTRAYSKMLESYRDAVQKLAQQIVDREVVIDLPGVPMERIESAAQVVVEDGWWPAFAMIDGDDAERNALELIFPDMPIRACQFHVMQACRSKARKVFGRHDDFELLTKGFMEAVRRCQRCPDEAEWPTYFADLEDEIRNLVPDDEDGEAWELLRDYLEDEWFSDRWRPYVVDYGQESNVTRDGPGSTNNFVEKMFRTFDAVFLGCRANKRLDRLLSIIITQFFPFYEMLARERSRPSPDLQAALFNGAHRWETDRIHPCSIEAVHATQRHRFYGQVFAVYPPPSDSNKRRKKQHPHFCGLDRHGRETCTCTYLEQTGKRCVHIWAMVQYDLVGSVRSYSHEGARLNREYTKAAIVDEESTVSLTEDVYDHGAFWNIGGNETMFEIDMSLFDVSPPKRDPPLSLMPSGERRDRATGISQSQRSSISPGSLDAHPRRRDISPIGRRYQDQRANIRRVPSQDRSTWPAQSSGEALRTNASPSSAPVPSPARSENSSESILQWNRNGAGRPANIQPKDPYRRTFGKSAPSTLSKQSTKRIAELSRPTGLLNTGYDCYASSLFQVLLRQPLIEAELDSGGPIHGGLKPLLVAVREAFGRPKAISFPNLRVKLFELYLVDDPDRMDDPLQLFSAIMNYVARDKEFNTLLVDFFSFSIESTVDCSACGHTFVIENESHAQLHTLLVRPRPLSHGGVTPLEDLVQAGIQMGTSRNHRCPQSTCGVETYVRSRSTLFSEAPFFNIQIAWDLFEPGSNNNSAFEASRLRIPLVMKFDERHLSSRSAFTEDSSIWRWNLVGIICKIGTAVEGGHYIAIVRHMRTWWTMDDQHIVYCPNPATEAFARGKFPVMLFYSRYEEPIYKSHWESVKRRRRLRSRASGLQASDTEIQEPPVDQANGAPAESRSRTPSQGDIDLVAQPFADSYSARQRDAPSEHNAPLEIRSLSETPSISESFAGLADYLDQECPPPTKSHHVASSAVRAEGEDAFFPDWIDISAWSDIAANGPKIRGQTEASHRGEKDATATGDTAPINRSRVFGTNAIFTESTPTILGSPIEHISPQSRRGPLPYHKERFSEWLLSRDDDDDPSIVDAPSSRAPSTYGPHTPLRRIESVFTSSPNPSLGRRTRPRVEPGYSSWASVDRAIAEARARADGHPNAPEFVYKANRKKRRPPAEQGEQPVPAEQPASAEQRAPAEQPAASEQPSSSLATQVLDRLQHVPFVRGADHGPLTPTKAYQKGIPRLSVQFFRKISSRLGQNQRQAIMNAEDRMVLALADFNNMEQRGAWWNNFVIDAAVLASTALATPSLKVKYVRDLVRWDMVTKRPTVKWHLKSVLPWPALGTDTSWRRITTVSVVTVQWSAHFATVAIFGPQRLVVVFDGAGGEWDDATLHKAWPSLLQSRLDYELRRGMADASDNEGWIFAPNTPTIRDTLGWCIQNDGCHCGPTATAAAYLLLWNIRPHHANLGSPSPQYENAAAEVLRDWFLIQILRTSHHTRKTWPSPRFTSSTPDLPWWDNECLQEIEEFIGQFGAKKGISLVDSLPPPPLEGPTDFSATGVLTNTRRPVEPDRRAERSRSRPKAASGTTIDVSIPSPEPSVDKAITTVDDASMIVSNATAMASPTGGRTTLPAQSPPLSPVTSPKARVLLHDNTLGLSVDSPRPTTSPAIIRTDHVQPARAVKDPSSLLKQRKPHSSMRMYRLPLGTAITAERTATGSPSQPLAPSTVKKVYPLLHLPGPTPIPIPPPPLMTTSVLVPPQARMPEHTKSIEDPIVERKGIRAEAKGKGISS